jgi:hypothetical protein
LNLQPPPSPVRPRLRNFPNWIGPVSTTTKTSTIIDASWNIAQRIANARCATVSSTSCHRLSPAEK